MLNIRFIIKMLGMMFILETLFMLAATAVAFLYEGNDFYPLLQSSGIMFGTGVLFMLIGLRANEHTAGRREGMLTVTLTWALFSLLGMLPFYLGGYIDNVTDAYFETMSGFTTTGSTILTDIEALPHGILFWRSLTQWQGGIGMIVFTVALMPIIGGGATQMFNAETPGITHERFRPRVTQVAKRLWGVYLFLTIILIGLLSLYFIVSYKEKMKKREIIISLVLGMITMISNAFMAIFVCLAYLAAQVIMENHSQKMMLYHPAKNMSYGKRYSLSL